MLISHTPETIKLLLIFAATVVAADSPARAAVEGLIILVRERNTREEHTSSLIFRALFTICEKVDVKNHTEP